jgi:hypothetical protein
MAHKIRKVDYFYTTVRDEPGAGYRLLSTLAELGFNLQAFTAVTVGPDTTQLAIFPDDSRRLQSEAGKTGLSLDGPHPALLVQGDDSVGVLAALHEKLHDANVSVYASNAVSDGEGNFGYIIYVRPEEIDAAAKALGL